MGMRDSRALLPYARARTRRHCSLQIIVGRDGHASFCLIVYMPFHQHTSGPMEQSALYSAIAHETADLQLSTCMRNDYVCFRGT